MKGKYTRQHTKGIKKEMREDRKKIQNICHRLFSLNPDREEKESLKEQIRKYVMGY